MNSELLDILAGRHCCQCSGRTFPREMGFVSMNAFAVEGRLMWEVWLHKHFWGEVAKGNIGLNPQKLFSREHVNFSSATKEQN